MDRIGGELERAQAELNEILEALTENAQEVERKKNNILEIETLGCCVGSSVLSFQRKNGYLKT